MAPTPPRGMIVAAAMTVPPSPALPHTGGRGTRSAARATITVTLHDTCVAPEHENTGVIGHGDQRHP